MWKKWFKAPLTSSIGHLFDTATSFANITHTQSYEGETGLQIEQEYDFSITDTYSYEIINEQIDISKMIKEIIEDNNKRKIYH